MADKLPEILQANLDVTEKMDRNQLQLQQAMQTFTASNKTFAKTSIALNNFAKQQVTKLNPFKSLKEKFDKSFIGQNMAKKKEEEALAKRVGLTREQLLILKAEKELKESQQQAADQLKASLEEYGLNTNTFFDKQGELQARVADRDEKGRFQTAKTIVDGIVGSMKDREMQEIENRREQARKNDEQTALLESLAGGIKTLGDNLLKGLKNLGKGGVMGLGVLASLVAAPVIILANFFGQLKAEFKILDKLTKGKLFEPFKKFGRWIKGLGGQFKAFAFEKFGKVLEPIRATIEKGKLFFKDIGTKIKGIFGKGGNFAKIGKAFSAGFQPIAKFAADAGKFLGKLFLPVTVIMGIIDGVKGFMEGFSEEGITGGIIGAIEGVLTGLVAVPLDLVKSMVSWVAEKLGFEGISEKLDSFSFAGLFAKLFDWIQDTRLAISDWISDKLLSLRALLPGFLGGMSDEEVEAEKAARLLERSERDAKIAENRLKKQAKSEGISIEELKDRLAEEAKLAEESAEVAKQTATGRGGRRGGRRGAEISAQSAQAAAAAGNVVVTTVAPTNISAPTSTSVSSQTNITPGATRSRRAYRGRRAPAYA